MDLKQLCVLFVAVAVFEVVSTQNQDELQIPVENDNQFPPEHHSETDGVLEGSGLGVLEEPEDIAIESTSLPQLEDTEQSVTSDYTTTSGELVCPSPCVCNIEGDSNDLVVDCSGLDLSEFPAPIDSRTTKLNVQNNMLKELSKDISNLKNLKILNANNNSIMNIPSGSISELPELTHLLLENNRLIEYPKDLKNSFILTKLQELNLGGNDIRTELSPELFTNFKSLQKLVVPTSTQDFLENVCISLKGSLDTVCTGSCSSQSFECLDAPQRVDDDGLLDAVLPGTIAFSSFIEDNIDPFVSNQDIINEKLTTTVDTNSEVSMTTTIPIVNNVEVPDFRFAVNKAPHDVANMDTTEGNVVDGRNETDVNVGATTTSAKTGGVDKSVIGFVVAGMVLVVAGVTIKKNWSSISKRCSSSPRPNERGENTANGTTTTAITPEEVPLQDKSPV